LSDSAWAVNGMTTKVSVRTDRRFVGRRILVMTRVVLASRGSIVGARGTYALTDDRDHRRTGNYERHREGY